ncbi:hypothetical protein QOT17_005064 [Balamuthia mandrillaris]
MGGGGAVVLLLLSGKRCSGKDTLAALLSRRLLLGNGGEEQAEQAPCCREERVAPSPGHRREGKGEEEFGGEERIAVRVVHLADELKRAYAEATGADWQRLLTDRSYKEAHRETMTAFYHQLKVTRQVTFFCESIAQNVIFPSLLSTSATTTTATAPNQVIILADLRHRFELSYFLQLAANDHSTEQKARIKVLTVRLEATEEARRGWGWVKGAIDEDITETDLDGVFSLRNEEKEGKEKEESYRWDFCFRNEKNGLEHLEKFVEEQLIPTVYAL